MSVDRILELDNQALKEIAQANKLRGSFWGKFPLTKFFVNKQADALVRGATVLGISASVIAKSARDKASKA